MTKVTKLNKQADINGTFRVGTFHARAGALIEALGEPHYGHGDKTGLEWHLDTPAGPATLYDYWWNAPDEWSIGGTCAEAATHVSEFLIARLRPDV